MTEHNQHISTLMDDETDKQFLHQLSKDKDMQKTWARYHLIGDCLRDTLPDSIEMDMAARVRDQLQMEPTVLAPTTKQNPVLKPVIGFAIAASVAIVAVMGIRQNTSSVSPVSTSPVIADNTAQPVNASPATYSFNEAPVRTAAINSDTPASIADQRMSGYLVNYNQYRTNSGMNGIMPYVRIVTIDPQE